MSWETTKERFPEIMTIGECISVLEKIQEDLETDDDPNVDFRDTLIIPENPFVGRSYRGYYQDMAIGYVTSDAWRERKKDEWVFPPLSLAIEQFKYCIGEYMLGYKDTLFGEKYRDGHKITEDTAIWVANWGDATGVGLVGITPPKRFNFNNKPSYGRVHLETRHLDNEW